MSVLLTYLHLDAEGKIKQALANHQVHRAHDLMTGTALRAFAQRVRDR